MNYIAEQSVGQGYDLEAGLHIMAFGYRADFLRLHAGYMVSFAKHYMQNQGKTAQL